MSKHKHKEGFVLTLIDIPQGRQEPMDTDGIKKARQRKKAERTRKKAGRV